MAEKRVDIVIAARNEADAAFRDAARKVRQVHGEMEKSQKSSLEAATRYITAFAKVRIAVDAARIGVHLYRGEWEKVNEAIDRLPMGIGEVARAMRPVADAIFEWAYSTQGYEASQRAYLERIQRLKQERELTNRAAADLDEMRRAAARDVLTGADAQAQTLNDQWDKMRERIEEIIRALPHLAASASEVSEQIARSFQIRLERVREDQRRQLQEEAAQRRRTLEDLDSDIRQRQMEGEGKHLEAELEQIRQHYKRRIELAKDAAEREKLERLRALDEQAARERAREGTRAPADAITSRTGVAPIHLTNGFMGLTARFMGGQDPAMRISRDTARVVKLLEQALKSWEKPDQIIAGLVLRP